MDRNNGPKEKWWRTCPADSRRLCNKEGQKNNKAKRQIYSTTAIKIKFWVVWSSIEENDEGSMVIVFMISFSIYLHLGSDITRIRLFIWYSYTLIGTINSNNKNKIYLYIDIILISEQLSSPFSLQNLIWTWFHSSSLFFGVNNWTKFSSVEKVN